MVMDNLGSHEVAGVRAAIEAAGAELRILHTYSPELDPIEQVFARLKAQLRQAEVRTPQALWDTIGALPNAFSPAECSRYLQHCGYIGST